MGLSSGNRANGDLVFLNLRSKDADGNAIDSIFAIARVNADGKIEQTDETATQVNGNLTDIVFTEREIKNTLTKEVTLKIFDPKSKQADGSEKPETFVLKLSYRIASRQLFNALLSLESPNDISVSIYTNKKGYEALSLWQTKKLVPWKFDSRKNELPEPEKIFDKKGTLVKTDFSDIDGFYETQLKELAVRLFGSVNSGKPAQQKSEKPVGAGKSDGAMAGGKTASTDDLPF